MCLPAEIIREKGTDRSRFFRGEVDKYTWQSVGSSFLPGELIAAFLWAQLEHAASITEMRRAIWKRYVALTESLEREGLLRRPIVPYECEHNAHIFYVLLSDGIDRNHVLQLMKTLGVNALFHYVPLHSSPAGGKYGRVHGDLYHMHFSFMLQKHLGIRTMVPPHPESDPAIWGSDPELAMKLGTSKEAVSQGDGVLYFQTQFGILANHFRPKLFG